MKRILAVMLVLTLLTTVFSFTVVEAKGKTVSLTGKIIKINQGEAKNKHDVLALKCEDGDYILTGNIKGMNKYIDSMATVKGTIYKVYKGTSIMKVKNYEIIAELTPVVSSMPIPTPTLQPIITQVPLPEYEELKGTLFNSYLTKERFLLKTEKGIYELMGNTKGLENEIGKTLLVTGHYVYTLVATEYPLFSVESYTVIEIPIVKTITMADNGGYVYVKPSDEVKLELETNPTTGYNWAYSVKLDPEVLIETNYEFVPDNTDPEIAGSGGKGVWTYKALSRGTAVIEMGYSRPWESVQPLETFVVKVIVEETPTPTEMPKTTPDPNLETITGTLTVTKSDVADKNSPEYGYLLKTQLGPVTLNGKTEGLEKYNGLDVEVTGKYSMLKIYPPIFIVESYKIISTPTPIPVVKTITRDDNGGYVYVKPNDEVKLELETNPTTGYDWSYIMKPDLDVLMETNYEFVPHNANPEMVVSGGKGVWTYKALSRGTVVIEMGYSRPWESVEPLETFAVKVIVEEIAKPTPTVIPVPTVMPEPTTVPLSKTHTILSEKAMQIAIEGFQHAEATGFTTISWTEGTERAFFSSKLNVGKEVYEFELVSVKQADPESIIGIFNVKKNGELVKKDIMGKLYGLSFREGDYFKFYSEDEKCHMSAYISKRLDF